MRAAFFSCTEVSTATRTRQNLIWHSWRWPYARIGKLVRLVPRSGSLAAMRALIPVTAVRADDMLEAGLTAIVLA
jgi:hypothetical protein